MPAILVRLVSVEVGAWVARGVSASVASPQMLAVFLYAGDALALPAGELHVLRPAAYGFKLVASYSYTSRFNCLLHIPSPRFR